MRIVHFVKEKFSTRGIAVSFKQAEVLAVLCPISVNWHNNPQLWMSMEMRSNSTWSAQLRWCVEQNWQLNRRDLNILIMKTSYLETKLCHCSLLNQIRSDHTILKWSVVTMIYDENVSTTSQSHAHTRTRSRTLQSDNVIAISLDQLPVCTLHTRTSAEKKPKKKFDSTIFLICFSMSAHTLCPVRFQEPQIILQFNLQFSVEKRNSHYSKDASMQFSYIATARMLILSNGI